MSKRTIAKFYGFVITLAAVSLGAGACSSAASHPADEAVQQSYGPPKVVGTIRLDEIRESSGIAASRCQDNVLWTHNDSGDQAVIYAISPSGESLGSWTVTGAQNVDWEDIALNRDSAGRCWLYIAETGNNKLKRPDQAVYRFPEPTVGAERKLQATAAAEALRFDYPDREHDAETLMVHPATGEIYVLTKRVSGPASVYKLQPAFGSPSIQKARPVRELAVPAVPNGLLTGGDISPDGTRVIICDYTQAYELVLPKGKEGDFDSIWSGEPQPVQLGQRKGGEAVAFSSDGRSIYATSEGKNSPVIRVDRIK